MPLRIRRCSGDRDSPNSARLRAQGLLAQERSLKQLIALMASEPWMRRRGCVTVRSTVPPMCWEISRRIRGLDSVSGRVITASGTPFTMQIWPVREMNAVIKLSSLSVIVC